MRIDSAILTYHSLDDSGSVISVHPQKFAQQMRSLADSGIQVVSLPDALRIPGSVAITFDDAFLSFYEVALPLLTKYQFPATVFVVTGLCGTFNDWPQFGHSVPRLPLMDWEHIRNAASQNIIFGGHTHTHARLQESNAKDEMRRSRDELEQKLGVQSTLFAYPYGHVDKAVRDAAASIFTHACGTELGYVHDDYDTFCLPRIDAYYASEQLPNLMTQEGKLYLKVRRQLRSTRKWFSWI